MKKFIAFEGIDGSGKSTQLKLLLKSLKKAKINFLSTREPGGTMLFQKILEKYLLIKKIMKFHLMLNCYCFMQQGLSMLKK